MRSGTGRAGTRATVGVRAGGMPVLSAAWPLLLPLGIWAAAVVLAVWFGGVW